MRLRSWSERIALATLVVTALVVWAGCTEVNVPTDGTPEGIRVSGTGKVTATPDIARAQIGVQTFAEQVEDASAENNRIMADVITALKGKGIEEQDIRTSSFQITPRRDFRKEQPNNIVGYDVVNMVSVTMRDLPRVGEVLQAALAAGANTMGGVQFTVEDPSPFQREARTKAVEDARDRAESMAQAAGVTLGDAVSIAESSGGGPIVMRTMAESAVARAEVPVQPGELEIVVTVEVLYEIK